MEEAQKETAHGQEQAAAKAGVQAQGQGERLGAKKGIVKLTQQQAENIKQEIMRICNKYGLWHTVEYERKPDLRMIRIKDISIKVER